MPHQIWGNQVYAFREVDIWPCSLIEDCDDIIDDTNDSSEARIAQLNSADLKI